MMSIIMWSFAKEALNVLFVTLLFRWLALEVLLFETILLRCLFLSFASPTFKLVVQV